MKEVIMTKHSMERMKERSAFKGKRATRQVDLAFERGKRASDMERAEERQFLTRRCRGGMEAVAYNGYCYIFEPVNKICITVYRLPADFGRKTARRDLMTWDAVWCGCCYE